MAGLSNNERYKLEQLFEMGTGYVLDFSNSEFRDFVQGSVNIDIYDERYTEFGESKAKRLRSFWKNENNLIVATLTEEMLERWKTKQLYDNTFDQSAYDLYDSCREIVNRLKKDSKDSIEIEAHFEKIQTQIIEQIKAAQFLIWVAVAWFTDKTLFKQLALKKNQGINVQLILLDDEINKSSSIGYEDEFETYWVESFGKFSDNILHSKFCVIDLQTVIHGSYNWTKRAMYNYEEISIQKNRKNAESFAKRFIELKKSSL